MARVWPSVLVHVLTASGVLCALQALRAVFDGSWEAMFAWLGLALIIDGIDGTFARITNVTRNLPRFSGERLDLIVDYLTYVVVPALALWKAGYLPGIWGWVGPAFILMSSLFHFSDVESKADDYAFVGFPAIWNIVAFYVFALGLSGGATVLVVLIFTVLTFVPWKWAHPMRSPFLQRTTLIVCLAWASAACETLWRGFPASRWASIVLLASAFYAGVLTLLKGRAR